MNAGLLWIAQGFGSGRIPRGPGTAGSVVGLAWAGLLLVPGRYWPEAGFWIYLAGIAGSIPVSIWLCGAAERHLGRPDPGSVVLDEIVAMPLCLLGWVAFEWFSRHRWPGPETLFGPPGLWIALAAFGLFRFFDIAKPWPVKQSQVLPGGWGITVDDLLAALYVNLALLFFVK